MPVKSVTVRVPAKVNLQLSVGPKESDGYHNLVSVFQAISIFDDVTIKLSEPGAGLTISISGDQTHGVPADANNLAAKAVALISKEYDLTVDAHIEIKTSIPVAGGMAGGSADAAATIVGIDYLYSLGMTREEMVEIAALTGLHGLCHFVAPEQLLLHVARSASCSNCAGCKSAIPPATGIDFLISMWASTVKSYSFEIRATAFAAKLFASAGTPCV